MCTLIIEGYERDGKKVTGTVKLRKGNTPCPRAKVLVYDTSDADNHGKDTANPSGYFTVTLPDDPDAYGYINIAVKWTDPALKRTHLCYFRYPKAAG
jgi:hypothetical protein